MSHRPLHLTNNASPSTASSVLARLRAVRLRPTTSRIHIILTLEGANGPMTAENLLRTLMLRGTPIGMGTAYRVLTELTSVGLLQRAWVQGHVGAKAAYSVTTAESEASAGTHWLTCERCGRCLSFIDAGLLERLRQAAELSDLRAPKQGLSIKVGCMGSKVGCPRDEAQGASSRRRVAAQDLEGSAARIE